MAETFRESVLYEILCVKRKRSRKEEGGSIIKKEEVRRQTLSSALGVESPESGRVPWVRLESVIGRIT